MGYIYFKNEKVFYLAIGDKLGRLTIFEMKDNK